MDAASPLIPRALLLAALLALAACASVPPPISELSVAQQSIAQANTAEAGRYAAQDLARAQSLLNQAQATMASGQNDQALQLAWRASAAADLARARAHNAAALDALLKRRTEIAELRQRMQQELLP